MRIASSPDGDSSSTSPNEQIPFAIESDTYRFAPEYYPKRFTEISKNEVDRSTKQCGGEDVYVKNTKNAEYHANGIVLQGNIAILRKLLDSEEPVDLITPIAENGGVECVLKKGEVGEIVGWDNFEGEWQFNYSVDLVATGTDSDSDTDNQIVSELIDGAR